MRLKTMLIALTLTGCSGYTEMARDFNNSAGELMGTYSAPTLAGAPTPSGCNDPRCAVLDALEQKAYDLARQKKITWVKLVDAFYQKRAEMYPNSRDGDGANELRTYQRALAEQMDQGRITESQWAYLIERKKGDIRARNQAVSNTVRRQTNCTTTNVGTSAFPEYKTTCN
jgi:hypothetical protein